MNILSLFDGCSGAQVAINNLGIKNYNYFSCEIDKYCITITSKNFPKTIHLGDIRDINTGLLPPIDLVIGGSPCQGFSFAGKQLNFDDPRSKLFFEFVEIVKKIKPKFFLLENVKMKKEYLDVITENLGVSPVFINSSLVSAQNRQRYYWCNWPVDAPKDLNIRLVDVLEDGIVDRDKSYCLDANYFKGGNLDQYFKKSRRQLVFASRMVGRRLNNGKRCDNDKSVKAVQRIEINKNHNKTNCLTTVYKDNLVVQINPCKKLGGKQPQMQKRVFHIAGNSHFLTSSFASRTNVGIEDEISWRKLTPIECERLQTLPDNYTKGVSDTQRYKMLGNGFTVKVIEHLISCMLEHNGKAI